ncbi:mannosyltransferase [Hwangdonia lutea]|uniref:Mannosyltransferase n=1 Tax=Hwangdonia lutea TaxID=3075823 RepID=A0AA97HRY1_9FLAO|nr:mannosyltransferase [Hwangdonia sp. SCSIO 19198]WOD44505.1 mannosyltransferase [Hwangdonia sp. SCSIO 19198]
MFFNTAFFKLYKTPLLLAFASLLLYTSFAYDLVRTDYIKLVMLYVALFFLFYKLVQLLKGNIKFLTWLAFGFRAVFILAIPNLSQDFYRFIWDGRLLLEGFNPYLFTVESFIGNNEFPVAQAQELYNGMGALNAGHYTNYPPINQLCFVIAGLFSGESILGSVIVMRVLIIAADFGTLYFGKKLLEKLKIPTYHIFWYILNPFIIIELTGNLHFEGVMIFFLIWSLYLLHIGKWQWAAVVLGLSVSVKLIPLIFLPLFWQWFTKHNVISTAQIDEKSHSKNDEILKQVQHDEKKTPAFTGITKLNSFYVITSTTVILSFLPFYSSEFTTNYTETVALWFNNFEFNASLYYIARAIGYTFRGYNEIAVIGKITPIIVILLVLIFTFFRKNKTTIQLITAMLLVLSFYYFTATTVHPWYIATLLILSVFTKFKFPLVWSFVIILSYLAYLNVDKSDKSENLWIIALEYIIVYSVFIWEVFLKEKKRRFKRNLPFNG